jgi:hypothetical protein
MAIRPPSGMIAPNDSVYHKRFQVYAVVTIGEQSPRVPTRVELAGAQLSQLGGIALCLERARVADVDATGLWLPRGR